MKPHAIIWREAPELAIPEYPAMLFESRNLWRGEKGDIPRLFGTAIVGAVDWGWMVGDWVRAISMEDAREGVASGFC